MLFIGDNCLSSLLQLYPLFRNKSNGFLISFEAVFGPKPFSPKKTFQSVCLNSFELLWRGEQRNIEVKLETSEISGFLVKVASMSLKSFLCRVMWLTQTISLRKLLYTQTSNEIINTSERERQ